MDKEQITFAGIPIPLTMETLLSAMLMTSVSLPHETLSEWGKRKRQHLAFRARILRMGKLLEQYQIYHGYHMGDIEMIETITEKDEELGLEKLRFDLEVAENMGLKKQLVEKDARIERILAIDDAHKLSHEFALEEKDARIAELEGLHNESMDNFDKLEALLATKDARIAKLEKWVNDNVSFVNVNQGANNYEWSDIDD